MESCKLLSSYSIRRKCVIAYPMHKLSRACAKQLMDYVFVREGDLYQLQFPPKKMAWFGGVRSFHSTCLKSYAHSLACLPDVSLEKVRVNQ